MQLAKHLESFVHQPKPPSPSSPRRKHSQQRHAFDPNLEDANECDYTGVLEADLAPEKTKGNALERLGDFLMNDKKDE